MRLGMHMTLWASLVFAAICFAVGVHGLWSLRAATDEALRADAHGFAWFWLFLGAIALLMALLARLATKGKLGPLD
jgi:hypothetical protein